MKKLNSTEDAFRFFAAIADESQEVLVAAFLTSTNRVILSREIFRGTLDRCLARPREILREALLANAAKLIIAHNHPSHHLEPSRDDRTFTYILNRACKIIGIPLLDHLIIGHFCYFSFREHSLKALEMT